MKKICVCLLVFCLSLSLFGCGSNDNPNYLADCAYAATNLSFAQWNLSMAKAYLINPGYISDEQLSDIENDLEEADSAIKSLKNPPRKYKDLYKNLCDMYDATLTMNSLVTFTDASSKAAYESAKSDYEVASASYQKLFDELKEQQ